MKKVIYSFIFFLLLVTFIFLNFGKWMDVTEEPIKSDIIICLGGGTIERVKKSIELLEQGYVEKNVFLLLGESWYNQPYIKENYPKLPVVIEEGPQNSAEEMRFIKSFMKEQGYKSALIVTDPPHSRRVNLLSSLVSVEGDEQMTFRMIDSDVKWWNKEHYYKNERARSFVRNEMMGILHNFFHYGLFYNE